MWVGVLCNWGAVMIQSMGYQIRQILTLPLISNSIRQWASIFSSGNEARIPISLGLFCELSQKI